MNCSVPTRLLVISVLLATPAIARAEEPSPNASQADLETQVGTPADVEAKRPAPGGGPVTDATATPPLPARVEAPAAARPPLDPTALDVDPDAETATARIVLP